MEVMKCELTDINNITINNASENLKNNYLLSKELEKNKEKNDQINLLEKRIEFILENEINFHNTGKDKLRKCLTELMKENEKLKDKIKFSTKEEKILNDKIFKLNTRIFKLTNQVKKKEKYNEEDLNKIVTFDKINGFGENSNNPLNLLKNNKIPKNLNFRINSLKQEYLSKINFRNFIKILRRNF